MDVKIVSFSFNTDMKPTVQWTKTESGNCLVNYFVEVTSSTGGKVQKGPITSPSVIVDDFKEPQYVTVFAMKVGQWPRGFVKNNSWQSGYQPKDSPSTEFIFTKTTTTTATTIPTGQLRQLLNNILI